MRDIFDDESGDENSSEFARLFENSLKGIGQKLSVGDKIHGEILSVGKDEIFVSTGMVDDGVVLKSELLDGEGNFPHKVGDTLELYVTRVQGSQVLLSPKPTAKNLADDLEDAFDMMLPVEGRVTEVVNGGLRVSVMGKTAFCPMSQIDLRFVDDPQSFVGKKFEFMITQFDQRGRNIVVSRRKLLEEQKEAHQASFVEDHKPGDIVTGTITRIEKYGAFIELIPGLEGLCHISEIGWTRLAHPSEAVEVGQKVQAKVLKIEEGSGRLNISLSIKQADAGSDPWVTVSTQFPIGSVAKGRVERKELYGVFVRLNESIVGLLPKSKAMENPEFPYDKLKVGDEVTVQINEIRSAEKRISLSVPQDPDAGAWRDFAASSGASTGASKGGGGQSLGTLGEQFKGLFDSGRDRKR